MTVTTFPVGPLSTNCYLVTDDATGEAVIVDPGGVSPALLAAVEHLPALLSLGMLDTVVHQPAWRELSSLDEIYGFAETVGYPVIIRPSFTLGGVGGSIAYNVEEFEEFSKAWQHNLIRLY